MKRIALKWTGICLVMVAVVGGLTLVKGTVSHGSAGIPTIIRANSTICGTTDTGFCIEGPAVGNGPTVYPGSGAQAVPLTVTNYFGSPITITQITVTFTNGFPANCDPT